MRTKSSNGLMTAMVVACAAGAAHAQCTIYRSFVPDFDQRRATEGSIPGLPGDGTTYCVPTSNLNWFAYISNNSIYHGLMDGPRNWQSSSNYNFVTSRIAFLGALMGTNTTGGTGGSGSRFGDMLYIAAYSPGKFVVSSANSVGDTGLTPTDFVFDLLLGALPTACYGRYTQINGIWTRDGGHSLSLVKIRNWCGAHPTFVMSDPASDWSTSTDTTQSTFLGSPSLMAPTSGLFGDGNDGTFTFRTMWEFLDYSDSTNRRFLDGGNSIWPVFGLCTDVVLRTPVIRLIRPVQLTSLPFPVTQDTPSPNGHAFHAIEIHPRLRRCFAETVAASGDPPILWQFDQLHQTFTHLLDLTLAGPMASDRQGDLFITDAGQIQRLHFMPDGSVDRAGGAGPVTPPEVPDALMYDDAADELVGVDITGQRLLRYGRGLHLRSDEPLPTGMTLGGRASLAIDPSDGSVWVTSTGSPAIYGLGLINGGPRLMLAETATNPLIDAPAGLNVDERGHLLFSSNGVLREVVKNANGNWVGFGGTDFGGRPAGFLFKLARSRTNFNATTMIGPMYRDEPPQGTLPQQALCVADFNGDDLVNVADYLAFLQAYSQGLTTADFTQDGVVNVQDYLAFLQAYSAGCL
jgi:hypothetical protein